MSDYFYPLLLQPVTKDILWGGNTLRSRFYKKSPDARIAESWELTCRSDAVNTIANGPCTGMTLAQYISAVGASVLFPDATSDSFPLLVKFIDAAQPLSIQVHPDDAYAGANETESGKTELWYIVDAAPGATIVYGLKDGVSIDQCRDILRRSSPAERGRITDYLQVVPVHPGDSFFIPPGQIHAIGAGILIAEIQQNSTLTYRVFDYNRKQNDGSLRELHVEKAMAVAKNHTTDEITALRFLHGQTDTQILADCSCFKTTKISPETFPHALNAQHSFLSVLCIDGSGIIRWGNLSCSVCSGDSFFIPCGCPTCHLEGSFTALITEPCKKG